MTSAVFSMSLEELTVVPVGTLAVTTWYPGPVQVARPFASLVRSFASPCVPSTIFTDQATSSFAEGEATPIPTLLAAEIPNTESLPSSVCNAATILFHSLADSPEPAVTVEGIFVT